MTVYLPSLLVRAVRPLSRLRRRIRWLERFLETPLSDSDEQALRIACQRSGVELGAFYHWYVQKKVISLSWRRFDRPRVLRMVGALDRTCYAPLDDLLRDSRGMLLALPHFGLYINTIVGVIERVRMHRPICIFYGNPATHPGNEVFDLLCRRVWLDDPDSNVRVLYDTRSGLAKAIRALESGAVVIIMPDVFKDELDAFQVPFCGRAMNVMLGTASLARRTAARIVPIVCTPVGRGMDFSTEFGDAIEVSSAALDDVAVDVELLNYRMTLRMFRFYETVMSHRILFWQFARQHYAHQTCLPSIGFDTLSEAVNLFVAEARVSAPHAMPLAVPTGPLAL